MHKGIKNGAILFAVMLATVLCAIYYIHAVNLSLTQGAKQFFSVIALQSANVIKTRIDGDFKALQAIALMIEAQPGSLAVPDMQMLSAQSRGSSFQGMGLILRDDTSFTTGDMEIPWVDSSFFERGMREEAAVLEAIEDQTGQAGSYIYTTPVYYERQVAAVLFASKKVQMFFSAFDTEFFKDRGCIFLLSSRGDMLVHSLPCPLFSGTGNIFESGFQSRNIESNRMRKMRDDLLNRQGGVIEAVNGTAKYFLGYYPIGINRWYAILAAPIRTAIEKSAFAAGSAMGGITVLIVFFVWMRIARDRDRKEAKVLSHTDPVTGGGNWDWFEAASKETLRRSGDQKYAMVLFDIDEFRVFNDQFGHAEGDRAMRSVWNVVRESLDEAEPFARAAADHFNILMKYRDAAGIERRLKYIAERIQRDFLSSVYNYSVKLSFGVYCITDKTAGISQMSDRSNLARKMIKGNRECMVGFYDQAAHDRIIQEKNIENAMAGALENGEFKVYFQPKYSISSQKIVGAEALVRWRHRELGTVPPSVFIPIFEKNGFVENIDIFVFEKTCEKLHEWIEQGVEPVPISVNVSRLNLHNPEFAKRARDIAQKYDVPCRLIELELTESTVIDFKNTGKLIGIMNDLKAGGFTIAMDDFGSGYSSLNMLRWLPVDVLKLDREFFGTDTGTRRGEMVISDMVSMAKHLDIVVVAEGVETAEQVQFLSTTGCDIVQGYYFARPMPIECFEKLRASAG